MYSGHNGQMFFSCCRKSTLLLCISLARSSSVHHNLELLPGLFTDQDIWNEKKMWGWWVFQNYRWGVHSVLPPPSTGSSTTLCSRGRSPSSSSLSSTPCQRRKERGDWRQRKQRKQRRWENLWLASLYSSLSARLAQWSNSRSCFIFKIKSGPKNEN